MRDIPVTRGLAVRVQRKVWRGKPRLDVRTFYGFSDPDSLQPTRKGVSLALGQLPTLLAALHEIEAHAVAKGELLAEDYEAAGLDVPAALAEGDEAR